jgi:hypothetical protein
VVDGPGAGLVAGSGSPDGQPTNSRLTVRIAIKANKSLLFILLLLENVFIFMAPGFSPGNRNAVLSANKFIHQKNFILTIKNNKK